MNATKKAGLIFDWNCGCWPKLSNPYLGQHQILHLPDPSGHLFSWLVLIRMTGELERNLSWLGGLQRQSQSCQRWSCHEKETAMPIVYVENTVRDKETGALFQKDFHFFSSPPNLIWSFAAIFFFFVRAMWYLLLSLFICKTFYCWKVHLQVSKLFCDFFLKFWLFHSGLFSQFLKIGIKIGRRK